MIGKFFVLGLLSSLMAVLVIWVAYDTGRYSVVRDCEEHRIFIYHDEVYRCRRVGDVE